MATGINKEPALRKLKGFQRKQTMRSWGQTDPRTRVVLVLLHQLVPRIGSSPTGTLDKRDGRGITSSVLSYIYLYSSSSLNIKYSCCYFSLLLLNHIILIIFSHWIIDLWFKLSILYSFIT
jgi:hypothetical protein